MPKLKLWVGRTTTLTIGEQTYRGEVVRELFQCERPSAYGYLARSVETGYALKTGEGKLIRIFMSGYPRVVAHTGGLVSAGFPRPPRYRHQETWRD